MTADPKLVEAVARIVQRQKSEASRGAPVTDEDIDWLWRNMPDTREKAVAQATELVAAINASGEWWVAPTEATHAIRYAFAVEADKFAQDRGHGAAGAWAAMRTGYLAKTEETKT